MPGENIQDWSTTAATNATADTSINWAEGQPRASVNNSARSMMAAHAKDRDLHNGSIVTSGTADAQAFTTAVPYTAVPTGMRVLLKIGAGLTNTGATTLDMNGIGAVAIKNRFGTDLLSRDIIENTYAEFVYNGTNWIALQNPVNGQVLLATGTVTGGTSIDFTTGIDATYDEYLFVLSGLGASAAASLGAYVSVDGGASFITSSTYWWGVTHVSSHNAGISGFYGSGILGGTDLVRFSLGAVQENVSYHLLDGEFRLFRPGNNGTYKRASWHTGTINTTSGLFAATTIGGGTNVGTTAPINAVRFSYPAGTISGSIYLYGVRK